MNKNKKFKKNVVNEKWEMRNEKWETRKAKGRESYELTKNNFFYWFVKLVYKNELLLV